MTTPHRPALDADQLRQHLLRPDGFVTELDVVESTTSTNADLLAAAARGAPSGSVLIAEYQRSGRGRFDRTWSVPPRAGVLLSVLVRPGVPPDRWGWLPLSTGLAVRAAVARQLSNVSARLKWPNDLLLGADERKAAGILVQAAGDAAVIGVGLNVDQTQAELPVDTATSLRLAGGGNRVDRAIVVTALLDELAARYRDWSRSAGDPVSSGLRAEYERHCATLGRPVRVERPAGAVEGMARTIDAAGALVVESAGGVVHPVAAGDVVHVRDTGR